MNEYNPLYRIKKGKFLKRKLSWGSLWKCFEDVFFLLNGSFFREELKEIQNFGILSYLFLTALLMPYVHFNVFEERPMLFLRAIAVGSVAIPLYVVQSIISLVLTVIFAPLIALAHLGAQLLPKKPKIKKEAIDKDQEIVATLQLQDIRGQGHEINHNMLIPPQEKRMVTFGELLGGSYEQMQRLYFREVSASYILQSHEGTFKSTKIFFNDMSGQEKALILYQENPEIPDLGIPLGIAEKKPENYRALKSLLGNAHFSANMKLARSLDKPFLTTIYKYEEVLVERQKCRNKASDVLVDLFKLDSEYKNSKPNHLVNMANEYLFSQDYASDPKEFNPYEVKPDKAEEINYPLIVPRL